MGNTGHTERVRLWGDEELPGKWAALGAFAPGVAWLSLKHTQLVGAGLGVPFTWMLGEMGRRLRAPRQ